jgi:translocation and assembly module TamB
VLSAAVFLAWLLGTQAGLHWALEQARSRSGTALAIDGAHGKLAGTVSIERLRYAAGGTSVEARHISGRAHLAALLGARLVIEPLRVESVEIKLADTGDEPPPLPQLPLGLRLGQADVGRLELQKGGRTYALRNLRVAYLDIAALRPNAVSAEASVQLEHERYPLSVALKLGGTLERLEAHVAFTLAEIPVDVRAVLTAFRAQRVERVEARAGPIDLASLDARMPHTALGAALTARASGSGLAGSLSLSNALSGPIDEARLPVASAETRFASADLSSAALTGLRIGLAGGGVLEGEGEVSAAGFHGRLEARRLDLRALRSTLRATQLSGPLEATLARDTQTVRGTLSQAGMTVSAEAVRRGDDVEVRRLHAAAEGGEVSGSGRLRLGTPLGFDAQLALARFNPAAFGDYPRGAISGELLARGELGEASRVELEWTLADSNLLDQPFASRGRARLAGQRVLRADVDASLAGSRASLHGGFGTAADKLAWTLEVPRLEEHVAGVSGRMQASGTLSGTWSVPQAQLRAELEALQLPHGFRAQRASAELSGSLPRHEGRLSAAVSGARIEARLRGGFSAGTWSGELLALEGAGDVPFHLRAAAPLKVARKRIELGRIDASVGAGRLLVRELNWTPERVASSGEFTGLPAQWLIGPAGLAQRVRSTLLLDGQWTIAAAPALEGELRLRRASGDLVLLEERPFELGLQSMALDARFTASGIGARLDVVSRYATAAVAGQLGRDPAAGLLGIGPQSQFLVQGQWELAHARLLAQPLLPEARFDGRLSGDFAASGILSEPAFTAGVRGDAIAFDYPPFGVYLKNGELRARLENNQLQVERFTIQGGEGRFSASGTLPLRFAEGNAKLAWQAKDFSLLERPDMRLVTSGEGEAGFDGRRLSLSGELRAERGHLEIERERIPKLGEDVVIVGQTRAPPKDKTPVPVQLNVDLDLGSNLTVHWQGLEGKLSGRVNVKTTPEGELRAYGKVQAVEATFFAYGQRLQVDPGVLIFDGPIDNPSLQVTAWRRNQAVEAGVQLSGTVRAPRVQLVSQPPVSEGERLSWLVLGRAPTDATKADLGLLQAAAGALLARGEGLPLDRRVARSFGLDEISFRGSGEVQDRAVAVGKRLSDKLYVSYEQGLGAVASNLVKLDYSLGRRWSLRAETGTSSGWGLFYRFSWD